MQAQYEHSPPTSSRSTPATRRPPSASAPAQCSPGDPPPRTITSYSELMSVLISWLLSAEQQLLAAVDVVRRPRERGVDHDVYGECGNVVRLDDPADRKLRAQLLAALVELVPEQRRRQRGVHESGRDQVDPHGRDLDGQAGR